MMWGGLVGILVGSYFTAGEPWPHPVSAGMLVGYLFAWAIARLHYRRRP